jgi:O-antigen ligase
MSGGVLDPMFQGGLLCFGLIILAKEGLNWSSVVRNNAWLFALLGYMLASVLWSDVPLRSFRSWTKEMVAVVMVLVVLTQPAPQEAMQILLRRTVYILIPFSILLIKYYPDLGVRYGRWTGEIQWVGVTGQKNALGALCLISAFFLVWTLIRRWQGRGSAVGKHQTHAEILLLLIAFWLFKGPSAWGASATAIYSLSVGLIAFFSILWMEKHRIQLGPGTWAAIMACIVAFGIITPLLGGSTVTGFTSVVGRDETLTGRTDIWAGLLPDVRRQPFLGYGFSSFWTWFRIGRHDIAEAHNGYLEVCLGLGIVGVVLTAMFLLSSTRKAARLLAQDFDWGSLSLCFLLMAAVHNIAESSLDSFTRHIMAIILLLSISVRVPTRYRTIYTTRLVPVTDAGAKEIVRKTF